jgi:hypothetical protein
LAEVVVDSSFIDGLLWAIIGMIIALVVVVIFWAITKYRTPKPSNNLTKAAHRHLPLILLMGLDHFADLYPLKDFIPEVLESFRFGKGAKRRVFRFVLPQKVDLEDIQVQEGKDEELTRKTIRALNDLNTEKVYIRGVNSPIFVGVKNRAVAASMPFLGALNWVKDLEQISASQETIDAMKKSQNPKVRDLGSLLARMATGVSMVDFHAIYKYVDVNWDQTIQDAISERDKTDGRLEGKEDKEKGTKTVLLLAAFVVILLIIAIIAVKVL